MVTGSEIEAAMANQEKFPSSFLPKSLKRDKENRARRVRDMMDRKGWIALCSSVGRLGAIIPAFRGPEVLYRSGRGARTYGNVGCYGVQTATSFIPT